MSDKITEGLEAHEAARKGQPIKTAKGSPLAVKDLVASARGAQRSRRRLKERLVAIKAHMTKWRADREKALANVPEKTRLEVIAAEEPIERDKAIEKHVEDIVKFRSTIHLAEQSIAPVERIFADSVAYLDVNTLGSDKR